MTDFAHFDHDLWPPAPPRSDVDQSYIETAKEMAEGAEEAKGGKCIYGHYVFWLEGPVAVRPGHIYSREGRDEFRISGMCEYCFDEAFAQPDCHCGREDLGNHCQCCCDNPTDGNEMGSSGGGEA